MNHKIALISLIIFLSPAASGQNQRQKAFMSCFEMNQPLYQSLYHEGKYQQALEPLSTLIHLLDTTTIHLDPEARIARSAIMEQKSFLQYDRACIYALMGLKKQALASLEESINSGYNKYPNMANDEDLAILRKERRFSELLKIVEGRFPLNVLRQSAPYVKEETVRESPFVYQPKESKNLSMVREYFKLDSVAGSGDELSKIINILHFAHDNIRHNGSNQAFAEMDAIDLYNYHKTTGKGVNCRQLAISLCEMYLAMGIPSRYVTCMPQDPSDYDCHVINLVWSTQMKKWLYIDPTMDAWVMDENGLMLSIAEVRERLIDGRPLELCETANHNHETPQTKEYYLEEYMAKNLYYFICRKISRFNPESIYSDNDPALDIKLIPEGFVNDSYQCESTSDPDYFWADPS